MFKHKEGRFSPAIIVSLIALVMAMAGSAVALPGKSTVDKGDLAKGSVTKKAIKGNAVTGKAIKAGAVTGDKIANGTVKGANVADGSIGAGKLEAGTLPTYAYAYVDNGTQIVQASSKNMGSATATLENSFVCFSNIPFAVKNVQVTTVRPGGGIEDSLPQSTPPGEDNSFCAGNESASVQFYDVSSNTFDGSPPRFYVTFQG